MMSGKRKSQRGLLAIGPDAPFRFVEAYKLLRTNMEFLSDTSDCKTVMITSSVPEEGKSNVAVNLAMTMAATDKKVVLVDGDLRKGTISRYLHVPKNRAGISSIIAGKSKWEDVLVAINGIGLELLPTGPIPPSPTEMLSTNKMQRLFEDLKNYADYIIVDTPPISVVTDAAILSRMTDGTVLVVRPGVTTIQGAQLGKRNLEAVHARILGVVINDYDVGQNSKRDGYYYSYGYYKDEAGGEKVR